MTFTEKLRACGQNNDSLVCVGLDPDLAKLPAAVEGETFPAYEFLRQIADATADLACAFKPQIAYFAGQGLDEELYLLLRHLREKHPEVPVILDAKRGDIGATAKQYAREVFDIFGADAVTVNPYMGGDTLEPFLERAEKGVFVLCRTSNPGAADFQNLVSDGRPLYEHVAAKAAGEWNARGNCGLVVGATWPEELARVRALCPELPLLVPGVGAQGGDPEAVVQNGADADSAGLLVNSSRGILYASSGGDFAEAARKATEELRDRLNAARRTSP